MSGVVTLSVEVELGWGKHDEGNYSHLSDGRTAEDAAINRLLSLCEDRQIPLSFDIVGHLYHESCLGHHEGPYPESWWDADPGTTRYEDPQFYAPDLIETIKQRPLGHEICTHTYSHIRSVNTANELLRHELQMIESTHETWGIEPPKSIVMPHHDEVDYDILREFDITTIRRPIRDYEREDRGAIRKFWWLLLRDHPPCEIRSEKEIVETTCTPHPSLTGTALPTGQQTPLPYFRILPTQLRVRLHRRYLIDAFELAAETGSHVHLWTHLYNTANDAQWAAIKPALHRLANLRDDGRLRICRMCDLAADES